MAETTEPVPMQDSHVTDTRARRFVAALRAFEQDSDPAGLAALFAEDATVMRLDGRGERTDVTAFWREYRERFTEISTTFVNAVEAAEQVAMEWVSSATLADDRPISYRGVTVLDLDGDDVVRLRTYYDSAAFTERGLGTR